LEKDPAYLETMNKEFVEVPIVEQLSDERSLGLETSRRDFLKYLGFGLGAATVAASCDIPVKKAIPYVIKPDTIVPGVATYYASSFIQGGDYCAVLVKTREGRPIKIEGNALSSITKGGTSARTQASVLTLYDTNRYHNPMQNSGNAWEASTWEELDKAVAGKLSDSSQIRIVTNTLLSPTSKKALQEFTTKYPNAKVVTYDAVSASAILEANEASFGKKRIPNYRFDKADVIVSFGADFLGTWISPIEYARQYAENRKIEEVKNAKMSHHIQVESHMSMTGSNADNRILVKPSEQGAAIANLYNALAGELSMPTVSAPQINAKAAAALKKVAKELASKRRSALVVSDSNNVGEQILVNAMNSMLDALGNTMSFANASLQRQGIDSEIQGLIKEMNDGGVDAVFVWGANPAFDLPNADEFKTAFAKVALKVSFAETPDETAAGCDFIAPTNHYLESWGDAEPKEGQFSLIQPTISPLFDTRQAEESLLRWANSSNLNLEAEQPYFEYLKARWEEEMFPLQNEFLTQQAFWDSKLHDGVFEIPAAAASEPEFVGDVRSAAQKINKPAAEGLEISFFETVNLGAGQYANNPWLQELPDPVTRCVWGNYLAIPIEFDGVGKFYGAGQFKNLNGKEVYGEADRVSIDIGGKKQNATVVRQFGQMRETVSLALGYGRQIVSECGKNVGTNVFPWLSIDSNGNTQYYATGITVSEKVATESQFACVQYHHTMGVTTEDPKTKETFNADEAALVFGGYGMVKHGFQGSLTDRTIINRTNLKDLPEFVDELHEKRAEFEHLNQQTLYPYDEYKKEFYDQGHHWGMYMDLNACTGCGTCQVACVSENNVPVVGKYEVWRHHEMSWLRIDRYFYGDYENPSVVYQPMLCQQCDNAPCENVCPVAATVHNSEGLNQMAYNRCIGTRYCANNCPYKVRRFNWLDYTTADMFPINQPDINHEDLAFGADNLTRMVLNPDVTVRSRGVMEKCSFCVQRIQEGKLIAKREGRRLNEQDVKTACQTACPTGAITFGDTNDKTNELNKKLENPLNYMVLEEIGIRPSIQYSTKVNNRDEELS